MFKRIIIATDLSPASFAVASCLGALKAYGTKECRSHSLIGEKLRDYVASANITALKPRSRWSDGVHDHIP